MMQKYFIAIVPPEPVLTEVNTIKQRIFKTYKSKGALRSPAHITLHMPFNWEEHKEEKLVTALQAFRFAETFAVSLSGFSCFEPRVVFVDVKENALLFQLQKELIQYVKRNLQLFNQAESLRGFHPHVTVAFRDLKKPQFHNVWNDYRDKPFEADFLCSSICLLKHIDEQWEVYKEFAFV